MKVLLALVLTVLIFFSFLSEASAKNIPISSCSGMAKDSKVKSIDVPDTLFAGNLLEVNVYFNRDQLDPNKKYFLLLSNNKVGGGLFTSDAVSKEFFQFDVKGTQESAYFSITVPDKADLYSLKLRTYSSYPSPTGDQVCDLTTFSIGNSELKDTTCSIEMPTVIKTGDPFTVSLAGKPVTSNLKYAFGIYQDRLLQQIPKGIVRNFPPNEGGARPETRIYIGLTEAPRITEMPYSLRITPGTGSANTIGKTLAPGKYFAALAAVNPKTGGDNEIYYCAILPIEMGNEKTTGEVKKSIPINPPGTPGSPGDGKINLVTCNSSEVNCIRGGGIICANGGVQTAIGCVPINPVDFVNGLMAFAAGAAGGVALLLMIAGSFQMITSQGNPDQLKKGREQFVAAATGLLFIIFSVTLLRIIGVDILQIPGFQ